MTTLQKLKIVLRWQISVWPRQEWNDITDAFFKFFESIARAFVSLLVFVFIPWRLIKGWTWDIFQAVRKSDDKAFEIIEKILQGDKSP